MPRGRRPALTLEDQRVHRDIIEVPSLAKGYDVLCKIFTDAGYDLRSLSGVIRGVAVWDKNNRYLFAWQVKERHILFYIRCPALVVAGELHGLALANHSKDRVTVNRRGETKIRLEIIGDAETLARWLLPRLPLPVVRRGQ